MPQVDVIVNGRTYPVACDAGQEDRIRHLARGLDARIAEFVRQIGQAGEGRLLILAALVLADELDEAQQAARRGGAPAGEGAAEKADGALAAGIAALAQRIEAVAARLESA